MQKTTYSLSQMKIGRSLVFDMSIQIVSSFLPGPQPNGGGRLFQATWH